VVDQILPLFWRGKAHFVQRIGERGTVGMHFVFV
jgi:hypothetical protein